MPLVIGENTILSNITLLTCADLQSEILQLPPNLIMQTIPLTGERFATFAFGFHDNMKATYNTADAQVNYFGQTLAVLAKKLECDVEHLFEDGADRSLWTLKIFPVTSNANESFEKTLRLISLNDTGISKHECVSIKGILQLRDISAILHYRSNLINCT